MLGDESGYQPRKAGIAKGGRYGYPSCCIAEGAMHVVYMRFKEDIVTCRVDLKELR